MVVHQLSQFRKRLVRYKICPDNCLNDRLGAFDHVRARQNTHSVYQGVDADQRRNLRLVVRRTDDQALNKPRLRRLSSI